jgi:hypothetical protein
VLLLSDVFPTESDQEAFLAEECDGLRRGQQFEFKGWHDLTGDVKQRI